MLKSDTLKQIVEAKYKEAKEQGKTNLVIGGNLGNLSIYIGQENKPTNSIADFTCGDEKEIVYVGGNDETKASS